MVAVEARYYRRVYYYRPSYYKPSSYNKPFYHYSQRGEHDAAGDAHDVAGGLDGAGDVLHDAASDHDAPLGETPITAGSVDLPAAEDKPVSPVSTGDSDLDLAILLGETDGLSDFPSLPTSPSNPTDFDVDIRAQG